MADRYLLESGAPDGYLLEDGSGVLLLDAYVTASISDNFDDNSQDIAKWALGGLKASTATIPFGGSATETNQRLEVLPNGTAGTGTGYVSVNTEDLTGKRIFVKMTNTATMGSAQEAQLSFGPSAGNSYNALVNAGTLFMQKRVSDGLSNLISLSYDATNHAWLSLRVGLSGNDTVYLDTAPSTASNPPLESEWTQQFSVARDSSISRTAAKIAVSSDTYAATTAGTVYFDGLNTGTAAATGGSVTGSAAITEASDTAALSGTVSTSGSVASTEANDTASASGSSTVSGSLARTENTDTTSISGSVSVSGSVAGTEANDTAAISGAVTVSGSLARTEGNDTASLSGASTVSGSAAITEASDTLSASGNVAAAGTITGSASITEASDTASLVGSLIASGSLTLTEISDVLAASGTVAVAGITGSVASSDSLDACEACGGVDHLIIERPLNSRGFNRRIEGPNYGARVQDRYRR